MELNHEVLTDPNWTFFTQWISCGDAARINDALHGLLWTSEEEVRPLDESSSLGRLILNDPIARAERIKIKDYIKHINWVYHKTQNLPNIVIIGSDNIPERLHGLRNANIILLDPKVCLPGKVLFSDFMQRRRFHVVDSYDLFDVLNTFENRLVGIQNVVIIDDRGIALDSFELEQKILLAGSLLTEHGRCLFDVPMYSDAVCRSTLYSLIKKFTTGSTSRISSNATAIDGYVHEVVASVNRNLAGGDEDKGYRFEIEDLKLTDVGLPHSVAMRVYLKKNYFIK